MTGNYENFLGKGSFGKVYKGTLKDQTTVAVKTYATAVDKDKVNEFVEEVKIQSKMIHKNVLRLKGCCLEVKFPVLIFEYVAEGSLRDIIDRRNRKMVHFPLERRLEIAVGAAEGLAYMHAYTASIIQHGDVKPDNILLDGEFVPKLADFGLSKQLAPGNQYVTHVVGSFGYMDPVLLKKGRQTPANDVYSFGVVLLELITRKAVEHDGSSGECTLVAECRLVCEEENRWREMLDQDITAEDDLPVLEGIFRLAIKCLAEEHRPDMAEVARQLAVLKKDWNDGKKNSQTGHHPEETTADDDAKSTVRSPSASQT
ncbi:hypothetical protein PR202_ga22083 [Eleusine coracana subsp. coracana]|uniref:Protein kinase domain-containing protein n=1 Tax=Eleusine coracana subsp. coracana TaxID=191504 RepID=A0AAV5D2K3_ELECO|nr:hypothetical protein PR202_ga22083 [Eleusine coracana subsp. coracana]